MSTTESDSSKVPSRQMKMGDRILVEPAEGEPFEATVVACAGWGLVHGVMNWLMRRDDGDQFTYGVHVDAPVQVIS